MVSSSATSTTVLGAQQTGKTNLLPINDKDGSNLQGGPAFFISSTDYFFDRRTEGTKVLLSTWLHGLYGFLRSTDNGQRTTVNSQQTTDNSQQSTDYGLRATDNGPIRMVVCCLLSIVCWLLFINVITRIKLFFWHKNRRGRSYVLLFLCLKLYVSTYHVYLGMKIRRRGATDVRLSTHR